MGRLSQLPLGLLVLVLVLGGLASVLIPRSLWREQSVPKVSDRRVEFDRRKLLVQPPMESESAHFSSVVEIGAELSGAYLQDSDGLIWLGTFGGGLYRYDGGRLQRFTASSGELSDSNVTALHEDEQGVIWIATLSGLDRYDKQKGAFEAVPLPGDAGGGRGIWSICSGANGALWLGTNGRGMFWFDSQSGQTKRFRQGDEESRGLPGDNVYKIELAADGSLLLATFGGGAAGFDPVTGRVTWRLSEVDGLSSSQVWSITEGRGGEVWIGTQDALHRFDPGTRELVDFVHVPGDPRSLGGRVITDVREDFAGKLWVTSFNGEASLSRLDPQTGDVLRFGEAAGLSRRGARTVFEDDGGVFWLVAMNGLQRLGRSNMGFKLKRIESGLLPIFEDTAGVIWLGTMAGLRRFSRETGEVSAVAEPVLAEQLVTAFAEDSQGRFWLATYGGELLLFNRQTETIERRFANEPGSKKSLAASNCIRRILEDNQDGRYLWLLSQGGGLMRFDSVSGQCSRFQSRSVCHGRLSSDTASYGALLQDPDGVLWVGTDDGLNRLLPGSRHFERIGHGGGPGDLASQVIQVLHRDEAGALWVATSDGLHRLVDRDPWAFERFTVADGLSDNMIVGLLEEHGRLWLSTSTGLTAFDPTGQRPPEIYGREEGLQGDTFLPTSFYESADGEFWFGGSRGVSHFKPNALHRDDYVPPVVITALTQGGAGMDLGIDPVRARDIRLSWPENHFEFEAAALSYSMPSFNRYRYKLEGIDEEWYESERGAGRYSSLPGGEYLLQVQGSNSAGVWNQAGASLRVVVEPAPINRVWVRGLGIFSLSLLLASAVHYFMVLRHELAERRRAERQRDLDEVRVREATRGEALERLASGVAHDFNNLLMVVQGEVELIRLKLDSNPIADLEEELAMVEMVAVKGADLTGQLAAFSSRRKAQLRAMDLNEVIRDSSGFLKRVLGEDIILEIRLEESLGAVMLDSVKIQQVLMNLASNARHAMGFNGCLGIRTWRAKGDRIGFAVSDTGSGIDMQVVERIFDPYFTTKRMGEGTGLGLAIVKEVVEQHRGTIRVESKVGLGTCFEMSFPIAPKVEQPDSVVLGMI